MGFKPTRQGLDAGYHLWSRKVNGMGLSNMSHIFAYGAPTHDFIVYPFTTHSIRIVAKTFPEAVAAYVAALLRGDTQ